MRDEDDPKGPRTTIEGDVVAGSKRVTNNYFDRGGAPRRWSPPPLVQRYLDWLGTQRMGVDLRGVGGADLRLDLREVYVPLSLTRQLRDDPTGGRRRRLDPCEGVEFEIAAIFARLDACRHAIVLGDPGSGKTTALRKLTQLVGDQARRATGEPVRAPVEGGDAELLPGSLGERALPIFIRARTFTAADLDRPLEEFVARELADVSKDRESPLDRAVTRALWRHGELVLLLDGLDEIADQDLRGRLCGWLDGQLATNGCNRLRVVITSRFSGYDGRAVRLADAAFARIEVRPLSAEQARVLIKRWFIEASRTLDDFPQREALARADHLSTAIEDPRFADHRRAMYATPLILTLLCVVVQRGHSMPESRAAFYETCLQVLLETWQRAKHEDAAEDEDEPAVARPLLPAHAAVELLRPIAYAIHESGKREQIERDELIERLGDRLDELGLVDLDARAALEWLHKRAAIFDELAPGEYGFFHLGLQEYLVALDIATTGNPAIDALAPRFAASWWVEVTLLAVSLPGRGVFARLMDQVLDTRALVDDDTWSVLRQCVLEASFDPAPFIARMDRQGPPLPPARLRRLLQLLRGVRHPEIAAAARRLADRSKDPEVLGEAAQLAATIERATDEGGARYDVAVVGLGRDRSWALELLQRLRAGPLRVWPGDGEPPPAEALPWELIAADVEQVVVVVGDAAPWTRDDHRRAWTLLKNLARKRPLFAALAPGAETPPGETPRQVKAWLDQRAGWDVDALVRRLRPTPARPTLIERVGTPIIEPITGIRLLWVPGGTFTMGSDELSEDSKPPHRVKVSPFWIGETPVTNRQYRVFVEQRKHREPPAWRDRRFNDPEQPVVTVGWDDAIAFCRWMSERTGWAVDLPSEAQWEFAARGTESRRFPWGGDDPDARRACFKETSNGQTAVVGSFPTGMGPYGTLDQAGNVWEWCKDVWDPRAYRKRKRPPAVNVDPPPATSGPEGDHAHAVRGGCWANDRGALAAAYRRGDWHVGVVFDVGFRVVVAREHVDP